MTLFCKFDGSWTTADELKHRLNAQMGNHTMMELNDVETTILCLVYSLGVEIAVEELLNGDYHGDGY